MIGRAYLLGAFKDVQGGGPKAVVLLNRNEEGLNKKMCKAFVDGLPSVDDITLYSSAKVLPTFWLLKEAVAVADMKDCKVLLKAYNYDQAQVLMAVYGRPGVKGPVMVAEDASQEFFLIDFSKANEKDMRRVLATWFSSPPLNGVVVSRTLWDRLQPVVCAATKATTTELAAGNPDPSKPGTYFDFAKNVFRNVNFWAIGAVIVGKTFNAALCPAPKTA